MGNEPSYASESGRNPTYSFSRVGSTYVEIPEIRKPRVRSEAVEKILVTDTDRTSGHGRRRCDEETVCLIGAWTRKRLVQGA